jgi:hypothetical protein
MFVSQALPSFLYVEGRVIGGGVIGITPGGAEEDSGFDDHPTVAAIESLLSLACRLAPDLRTANLQQVWAA